MDASATASDDLEPTSKAVTGLPICLAAEMVDKEAGVSLDPEVSRKARVEEKRVAIDANPDMAQWDLFATANMIRDTQLQWMKMRMKRYIFGIIEGNITEI